MKRRLVIQGTGALAIITANGIAGCGNIVDGNKDRTTTSPKPIPSFDASNAGHISDVGIIERKVHEFTNEFRVTKGLNSWGYDYGLADIARVHSRDMAKRNYLSHENPEGQNARDRAMKYGYTGYPIGENLAKRDILTRDENPEQIAQKFVEHWKKSTAHRQGLISERYLEEGVGVFIDVDGIAYATAIQSGEDAGVTS